MNTASAIAADDLLDFTAELEQAARLLDLEPWILQRLKHAEREITVNVPLIRDSGEAVNLTGYRVQHNRTHGPCVGPWLMSADLNLAQLRRVAAHTTLQCALLDLPLGGAAGALVVDAENFSERELRHAVKDYVAALRHVLGGMEDVLAPAVNEVVTAWVLDAYTRATGQCEPAAVVGKPPALGGLSNGNTCAAGALVALIEQALRGSRGQPALAGARVAIQGFGKISALAARRLHAAGARVIAVADRSGGVMRNEGLLDVERLSAHHARAGVLFGFEGADAVSNAEVLECDCDLLIAAAAERQIGTHNAARIRARVVLETVAGAVSPAAEPALHQRGVEIVPALLGTAATARAWALEWEFGLRFSVPDAAEVEALLCSRVVRAYEETRERARRLPCSLRVAAQVIAIEKLAAAMRLR